MSPDSFKDRMSDLERPHFRVIGARSRSSCLCGARPNVWKIVSSTVNQNDASGEDYPFSKYNV